MPICRGESTMRLRSRNTPQGLMWECIDCKTLIKSEREKCKCREAEKGVEDGR